MCERNFNLVELGPRGTGKSYAVQEISPYAALLTGGTTVANLFGQQQGRYKGLVQIWALSIVWATHVRHSRARGNPGIAGNELLPAFLWIPAFAGMTQ